MSGSSIAGRVLAAFAVPFPPGFLDKYVQLECLATGRGTETFLVRERAGEALFVAKCFDKVVTGDAVEHEILKSIHDPGVPGFVDSFEDERSVLVVREYVAGVSLDRLLADGPLPAARAVQICRSLCDILIRLHGREKPVIHRDIKPGNIIIRPDGSVCLIDFEISREYKGGAGTDTCAFGTRVYAPPEQYGFRQTDARADIYALGILLACMLTGQTALSAAKGKNARLLAVARRCAAFSPEARYPSAKAVKRALLRAEKARARLARLAVAVLLILLCGGVCVGRYTGLWGGAGSVTFREPLIERAVRLQLGKEEGGPLTREELQTVKEIYIFGDDVALTQAPFADGLAGARWTQPRGNIESLADIALLPNLETLYVNYQTLSDLSPLAAHQSLRTVNLRHTRVSDVTPLVGLLYLEYLSLYDTDVADASALDACPLLHALDAGEMPISSPADVGGPLDRLCLKRISLASLAGIEKFASLTFLDLSETQLSDLTPLLSLPSLAQLVLDESMRAAGEAIAPDAPFEIIYQ